MVDHRTDVYSLGATLYELLTLEPAFAGNDRQELLRQIAFEEPRPPRRLNRAIPAELETIVLKAMEKNPADRYATAKELADDLRRFLEDEPIQARRPSGAAGCASGAGGTRPRWWRRRGTGVAVSCWAAPWAGWPAASGRRRAGGRAGAGRAEDWQEQGRLAGGPAAAGGPGGWLAGGGADEALRRRVECAWMTWSMVDSWRRSASEDSRERQRAI